MVPYGCHGSMWMLVFWVVKYAESVFMLCQQHCTHVPVVSGCHVVQQVKMQFSSLVSYGYCKLVMLVVSVLVILSSCTGVDYSVNTYFSLGLKISRILFLFLFLSLIVVQFLSLVLVLLIVLLFNFLPLCYFVRSSLRFCENFLMFCFLSHSALSCSCHLLFKSWLYFMNRYCLVLVIFVWPATIIQFR